MKYLLPATLLLFCAATTPLSQAKSIESCEESMTDNVEYSRCLDGVKEAVDRELQTWVNNQTFILEEIAIQTGRKAALNMFKRSQSNFITYRENNCRWQYLAISPGTGAGPAYKKCYITVSQMRIEELSALSQ
ncbi:lysozyme inhibitor LprI family protein [Thalassotalea euphylliae]|uniref:lysozyme inhibitor LprI family protein n=1 Tax=Thalassotalea euphylliae TaxID=1655234 RepID=UPI0036439265